MIRVSFQGEHGAYSEAAAKSFFDDPIVTVALQTFTDVLESTSSGTTDYAILPVENSLEGSIGESYDLLYSTNLNAVGEIYYKIEHCLIGSGDLENVDIVYSHPQALGQCRNFIEKHGMKTVPTYDTAGSVKMIKDLDHKTVACIASRSSSEIYGMPIITDSIANNSNNYTRFLLLAKGTSAESGNDKTSIIFSIKHKPGSLFQIIKNFDKINMTKIESRPTQKDVWEYNFYVDFEGHAENPLIKQVLKKIETDTTYLKVLGSYRSSKQS